ncbi:MAG: hypothetical protein ABJF23_26775 [Bryobacteraceae bacterium]
MTWAIRKIHIYAGLLTFAQLMIYGIAGVVAALYPGGERPKVPQSVRYVPFTVPPSSTDKEVAALAFTTLNLPMARPVPDWYLRHTADNHLLLDFYNVNGIRRVVVLEKEGRLRLEEIHNSLGLFLEDIHAATPGDAGAPRLVHLWACWNEFAMWTLLSFCVSGLWLWLAARPSYAWAWALLAGGSACIAVLWSVFR